MLASLYGKLTVALMTVFVAIGASFLLTTEKMLGAQRLLELASELVIGAVAFSLFAALIVFKLLTRRLRVLAAAVDNFEPNGHRHLRLPFANANGDEIDRLGAAFQQMAGRIAIQLDQLQRHDEQQRELLANVSHDLRTPLSSMQGYLEILLLRHGTLPPEEERSYLEIAVKHSERLGKLVRDLFELTKLEAGEVRPNEEDFLLAELVQDVVQKFQLSAAKYGLSLQHHCADAVPAVHGDIGLIERVLENLIENAMRHTPSQGSIRVELAAEAGRVVVKVSDTGRGIPPEELASIFERYYRVGRSDFRGDGGTGLGLAISRRIVELHGGRIQVDSTLGVGTTFQFDLPCAAPGGRRDALPTTRL